MEPTEKISMFIKASHSRSFFSEKLILIQFVCHYSPVLDAAFNSGFVEGRTQTYELDDTRPGAFRFFVQWLYGQDIDLVGPYTESFDAKNVVLTSSDTDGEGQGRESGTGDEAMREGGAEAGEGVGEEEDDEDDTNEADDDNYGVTAYWSDEDRKFRISGSRLFGPRPEFSPPMGPSRQAPHTSPSEHSYASSKKDGSVLLEHALDPICMATHGSSEPVEISGD